MKKTDEDIRCVIIESPYVGEIEKNEEYARRCVADCLNRGEAPFASHLLYTQKGILRDDVPTEREWGIAAGLTIGDRMDATVVYTNFGISDGMATGIDRADYNNRPVEYRKLGDVQPWPEPCEIGEFWPTPCALEELNLWMAEWSIPEDQREWLLRWANRRAHNVIDFLAEPMKQIAQMEPPESRHKYSSKWLNVQFIARRALKTCALEGEENADLGNSINPASSNAGSVDRGIALGNRKGTADKDENDQ